VNSWAASSAVVQDTVASFEIEHAGAGNSFVAVAAHYHKRSWQVRLRDVETHTQAYRSDYFNDMPRKVK